MNYTATKECLRSRRVIVITRAVIEQLSLEVLTAFLYRVQQLLRTAMKNDADANRVQGVSIKSRNRGFFLRKNANRYEDLLVRPCFFVLFLFIYYLSFILTCTRIGTCTLSLFSRFELYSQAQK